jgi:oxygen-dependent protoporphyrinogen oxidase
MIGRLDSALRSVRVVGGGASGLFCAYALAKAKYVVSVYEGSLHLGGLLQSTRDGGALVERSAHSLVWTPTLAQLCSDIGVELVPLSEQARAKFIVRDGRMRRMPLGFVEGVNALLRASFMPYRGGAQNVRSFAQRHFGEAAADYLFEPLVTGIYGAYAEQLDMASCLPSLVPKTGQSVVQSMLFRKKSTSPGKRMVVAPRGGMTHLIQRLAKYLVEMQGVRLHLGTSVDSLEAGHNHVLAVPAPKAADILRATDPLSAALLQKVRYTPMLSVAVQIKNSQFQRIPQGLGVLIPPKETQLHSLGILFSSSSFPDRMDNPSSQLLTVMMGGQRHPDHLDLNDHQIEALIASDLSSLFSQRIVIDRMLVSRWPRAIPLYSLEHARLLAELKIRLQDRAGILLSSAYAGEVSLRGMLEKAMECSAH